MISVTVTNRKAVAVPLTDVTVGAVGIPVSFHFTEDWDGLSKIAVFKAGDVTPVEVAILNNTANVPHEVLVDKYEVLWIGIYGSNAQGTTVIPTIWANAGAIQPGTELETIDPSEPTPSWVAQVQAAAQEALTIANNIRDDADSGAFDGEDGTDGVSPTVTITDITGGHLVTITDANGNHSFSVMNGTDGQNGSDGQDGSDGVDGRDGVDGNDGADGVSPTVQVTDIEGGHRIAITDANGVKTFDVLNGQDGADGNDGDTGPEGPRGATGKGIKSFGPNGTGSIGGKPYHEYLMEFTDGTTATVLVYDGEDGQTGATPDIQIGTVTTLPTGSEATAEITGTPEQPRLNLGIPEGQKGDPGEVTQEQLDTALANKAPIITDTASGAIASFPDGADGLPLKSLVATIEPVQDLHGYDSPWPAGGWKNKANLTGATGQTTYGLVTTFDYDNEIITISGESTSPATYVQYGFATFPNIQNGLNLKAFNLTSGPYVDALSWDGTTQIAIIIIRGLSAGMSVNLKFQMVAYEGDTAPTAWTPYSNICPISGRTEAKVTRTGKNLCGEAFIHGIYVTTTGVYYSHEGASSKYVSVGIIPVKGGQTYTISWKNDPNNTASAAVACFYKGSEFVSGVQLNTRPQISVPENADGVGISLLSATAITSISQISISNPQLELGSTATAYEPYQGDELSVNWETEAGTVYGGTLDVTNGVLTVDRVSRIIDGNKNWVASDGYVNRFSVTLPEFSDASENYQHSLSNYLKTSAWGTTKNTFALRQNGTIYVALDPNATQMAVDEFKAFLNSNPLQFVYELANPQTYQLTPQEVETLLGTNNIWADTGDTTVEYRADTKLFIEQLTKPTEDDMTADHAISAGTFFQLGNTLYLATAQIAAGATITPGTNATRLSLADALNLLNS